MKKITNLLQDYCRSPYVQNTHFVSKIKLDKIILHLYKKKFVQKKGARIEYS